MRHPGRDAIVARTFDAWAARGWAAEMEDEHQRTARSVLHGLRADPGARVLELGCANGWLTRQLAAGGTEAVGLDLSRGMLDEARASSVPGDPVGWVQAAAEDLPFADEGFDGVVSMETLYYAQDLDGALRQARRVLRPGGWLLLLIDVYEPVATEFALEVEDPVPVHVLTEAEWVEVVAQAGFEDVTQERARAVKPLDADEHDPLAWQWLEGTLVVRGVR